MSQPLETEAALRRGNARIGGGILTGCGAGLLLGVAGSALSGQVRWIGLGLVLGAAAGLIAGWAGARRLRTGKEPR
jgi:hypothetical protein